MYLIGHLVKIERQKMVLVPKNILIVALINRMVFCILYPAKTTTWIVAEIIVEMLYKHY